MPPSRIDELRRRVQSDPASIAFAQLAEEYRRSGQTEDAVRVCRDGLTRHPGYLSARVTLGRALLDLGQLMGAREELEFVVAEAPENLAAVRGLAEICQREGHTAEALTYYQRALTLARHDPDIEEIVQQLSRQARADEASPTSGLPVEASHQELLAAAERAPLAAPEPSLRPGRDADEGATALFDFDRLVADLGSPAAPAQVEAVVEGRTPTAPLDLPDPISLGPDPFAALEAELRATEAPHPAARTAPWSRPDAEPSDPPARSDWSPAPPAPAELSDAATQVPFSAADVLADTLLTDVPLDTLADASDDVADDAGDAAGAMSDPFLAGDEDAGLAGDEDAGPAEAHAGTASLPEPDAWEDDDVVSSPLETAEAAAPGLSAEDAVSPMVAADTIDTVLLSVDASAMAAAAAYEAAPALLQIEEAGLADEPAATSAASSPAAAGPAEDVLDELEHWLTTLQDRSSQ